MVEKEQQELKNQDRQLFTDPIVTNHPYFMEKPLNTFLDEDSAMNINNSEMVYDPKEYE